MTTNIRNPYTKTTHDRPTWRWVRGEYTWTVFYDPGAERPYYVEECSPTLNEGYRTTPSMIDVLTRIHNRNGSVTERLDDRDVA